MLWEFIVAVITAIGSVASSVWVIKEVIKQGEKTCNARMEAFKEGLNRHEKD